MDWYWIFFFGVILETEKCNDHTVNKIRFLLTFAFFHFYTTVQLLFVIALQKHYELVVKSLFSKQYTNTINNKKQNVKLLNMALQGVMGQTFSWLVGCNNFLVFITPML